MRNLNIKTFVSLCCMASLSACASNHDQHGGFLLGSAMDQNIKTQSIRPADLPNSKGLAGQSGERAVAAIDRLNSGEKPDLSANSVSN